MIIPRADVEWGWTYRFLTLDNGLRALLISDPSADKSACSMDVACGMSINPSVNEIKLIAVAHDQAPCTTHKTFQA